MGLSTLFKRISGIFSETGLPLKMRLSWFGDSLLGELSSEWWLLFKERAGGVFLTLCLCAKGLLVLSLRRGGVLSLTR